MTTTSLSPVFEDIKENSSNANLQRHLAWLSELARILSESGSRFSQHNAYHPEAIATLNAEYERLQDSQIACFLHDKLRRILKTLSDNGFIDQTEQTVISSSFVLGTLVDMLKNPEQPFEIAALMFESQAMFDEWYEQLLEMTGLEKRH